MNEQEIKKKFESIEKRLERLENPNTRYKKTLENSTKNYKGLGGGINLLIHNRFFDTPKPFNEIFDEMKREGYHHSKGAVAKMLSVNFVKNKKILTRIKEDKIWKYVIRK